MKTSRLFCFPPLTSRSGRTLPWIVGSLLWVLVFGWFFFQWQRRSELSEAPAPDAASSGPVAVPLGQPGESVRPATRYVADFALKNCTGEAVTDDDLKGKVWVVSFVFTHCVYTCPTITLEMRKLQDQIEHPDFRLVTITVDPKRDDAERLKAYAEQYGADLDRWLFLTGEPEKVYEVITEGFGVVAQELFGEDRKPGLEITHTNRVILVNREGVMVDSYLATEEDKMPLLRRAIEEQLETGSAEPEPPQTDESEVEPKAPETSSPEASESSAPTSATDTSRAESDRARARAISGERLLARAHIPGGSFETALAGAAGAIETATSEDEDEPLIRITTPDGERPPVRTEVRDGVLTIVSGPTQQEWAAQGVIDFALLNIDGTTVTREDLLGHSWIAAFIFTRCAGPCPKVTGQMRILQDQLADLWQLSNCPLPLTGAVTGTTLLAESVELLEEIATSHFPWFDGHDVKLVTITVDPDYDTPEVLARYAEAVKADPERWLFLTGEKTEVQRLIGGCFRQLIRELEGAQREPGFEVAHSTNVMHVDAFGRIRGKYNAQEEREAVLLRRAVVDGRITDEHDLLAAAPETAPSASKTSQDSTGSSTDDSDALEAGSAPAAAQTPTDNAALQAAPDWVLLLPAVNATLNGLATVLLLAGYAAIKRGHPIGHKRIMLTSFGVSILFLVCYLLYHFALQHYTGSGSRRYTGSGWLRPTYFTILISHVVLAAAVPILALITIYRGLKQQYDKHRRIARVTFPIWLYVSVTGVIIYWMLYHGPQAV